MESYKQINWNVTRLLYHNHANHTKRLKQIHKAFLPCVLLRYISSVVTAPENIA